MRRYVIYFLIAAFLGSPVTGAERDPSRYRQAVLDTFRWLQRTAIQEESGATAVWPADPRDPKSIATSLYVGNAGIVLFFIEAEHGMGRNGGESYILEARAG